MYGNYSGCGFCDKVMIHLYPNSPCILKAAANFKRGGKIVMRMVMRDYESVAAYMARQPFCDGVPYRVFVHKGV